MIAAIQRALQLMLSSGEVIRTDWAPHPPQAQVHGVAGEVLDQVPILTPWGIAARPPGGARVLLGALGADRTRLLVLSAAHEDVRPPELAEGEVALYARGGAQVTLREDGSIAIQGPVSIEGSLTVQGSVQVDGSIQAAGQISDALVSLGALRAAYNSHTHLASGAPTSGPIPTS